MPSCKTLIDRLLKECCPNPKPAVNKHLAGMVCPEKADSMCKQILDNESGFKETCGSFNKDPDCR